ncbi:MAG TPA: hypothetical protein PLG43_11600, partial [Spirochaetia bacterium]|nr:hypothetical protein [Spirochaetia bacterium]
ALLLSLFFTFTFMVFREAIVPPRRIQNEYLQRSTLIARGYLDEAREAEQTGKTSEAVRLYKQYLLIDQNESIADKIKALEAKIAVKESDAKDSNEEKLSQANAAEYVKKAEQFFLARDYYSAHYYALKASALDNQRTDAERIAREAWERICAQEPSPEEKELSALYRQKREGYLELTRKNPIRAYYIFKELERKVPDDPEVVKYLAESSKELSLQSFFIDEAENALLYPLAENIFFMNPTEDGGKEFFFLKKIAENAGEYYASHVEVLTLNGDWSLRQRMTAPYGRISGTTMYLHCLHREDPSKSLTPLYAVKDAIPEQASIKPIPVKGKDLKLFSMAADTLDKADINELFSLRSTYQNCGFPKSLLYGELFDRLSAVAAFLIFSLFSISIGWALRLKRGKMPFTVIFVIPGYILITRDAFIAFLSLQSDLYAHLLTTQSLTVSFVALIVVQAVFLSLAFIGLTGQSSRS